MKILVTGGAGSIGSEVVRRLHAEHLIRVLDINEEGLWSLRAQFPKVDVLLGDVTCAQDVRKAAQGMDAVVHCAALKHVDLCEANPDAAIRVNVGGTVTVLQETASMRAVVISTDKAIEPHCVMGRTKAQAEMIALGWGANIARFGNVLGTRGSLIPMVKRCAKLGVDIPLTDPRMTRFIMPVSDAVDLIHAALFEDAIGRVYVPANPASVKIPMLLEVCRDRYAPGLGITRVGSKPGERLHEPCETPDGSCVWSNHPTVLIDDPDVIHRLLDAVDGDVQVREAA